MQTLNSLSQEQRPLRWYDHVPRLPWIVADSVQVFERGVASILNSVDLWTDYCAFKVETSHDPDVIREYV